MPRSSLMYRVLAQAVLYVAIAATTAMAQRAAGDSLVSSRLVTALVSTFTSSAQVIDGAVPPELRTHLVVPSGARVLGTLVAPPFRIVVIEASAAPDSALAQVARVLPARGWRQFSLLGTSGGFVSSEVDEGAWCSDKGESLAVTATARPDRGSTIRYLVAEGDAAQACRNSPDPNALVTIQSPPTLFHPEGMDPGKDGCSPTRASTTASRSFSDIISSTAPVDSLMAHYGRQLLDAGWTPLSGERAWLERTWQRPGTPGNPQLATVTISIPREKPKCRHVQMMVLEPE